MRRWLTALVLVMLSVVQYQQMRTSQVTETRLDDLRSEMVQYDSALQDGISGLVDFGNFLVQTDSRIIDAMMQTLDLSVLDSCGIITSNQGFGSCVAIRPSLMLTAGHCIEAEGAWIEVKGQQYRILKQWKSEQYDVGFVEIEGKLPFVELGQMPELLQDVWLVGAPDSTSLANTITSGIISQVHVDYMTWKDIIVSDTFSWAGNSGGPLFCVEGDIVGICVSGPHSLNVAESIEHIRQALEEYDNASN